MKNLILVFLLVVSVSAFGTEVPKAKKAKQPASTSKSAEVVKKEVLKPSKLQKDFLSTTGMELGEYVIDPNSSEDCQDGRLSIVDYGDELGLILGPGSLVVGIGKDKLEESYSDCKRTFKSKYAGNTVEEVSEEVCTKDGKTVMKTTVTVEKDRISYTVNTTVNDAAPTEFKCSLSLQKDAKK